MAKPIKCNFKGENNGNAKLKPEEVIEIIYLYETRKWTYQTLADKYGINKSHVSRIVRRKSWSNLPVFSPSKSGEIFPPLLRP